MDFYIDTDAVEGELSKIDTAINTDIKGAIDNISDNFGVAWQGPGADTVKGKIVEMKNSMTDMSTAVANLRDNVTKYTANVGTVDEVTFTTGQQG